MSDPQVAFSCETSAGDSRRYVLECYPRHSDSDGIVDPSIEHIHHRGGDGGGGLNDCVATLEVTTHERAIMEFGLYVSLEGEVP